MARIAVVGGGALGLLLAGRLAAAGCLTEVWTRSLEQAHLLVEKGIVIQEADGTPRPPAAVYAVPIGAAKGDSETVVLLAVKQTALTPPFLEALSSAALPGMAVAAFCNGIGHTDLLAQALPGRELLAAVTTEAALRLDARTVRHTGKGGTWLGAAPLFESFKVQRTVRAADQKAENLENMLNQAGFTVNSSNDMADRMLRKLLANAVINPLTALMRLTNGELTDEPRRIALMRTLFDETAAVLSEYGLRANESLWDEVLDITRRTAPNRSSMLQDVLAGRQTEIGSINGAVSRMAARAGLPAPWNDCLTELVQAMAVIEGEL